MIDKFHKHELMDRLHVINVLFEEVIRDHPAAGLVPDIDSVASALGGLYQKAGEHCFAEGEADDWFQAFQRVQQHMLELGLWTEADITGDNDPVQTLINAVDRLIAKQAQTTDALAALHQHMQTRGYYADDSTMPLFKQVVRALATHQPAEKHGIPGCGRITHQDGGWVELHFQSEAASQAFMAAYVPTVEVLDMPLPVGNMSVEFPAAEPEEIDYDHITDDSKLGKMLNTAYTNGWNNAVKQFRAPAAAPLCHTKTWKHAANEWADTAYNGLQWLRNIEDGTTTDVKAARENMERCCKHARSVADGAVDQAVAPLASSADTIDDEEFRILLRAFENTPHTSRNQLVTHIDARIAEARQQGSEPVAWTDDAEKWGAALNEAGWVFMESLPEWNAGLFNNVKPALRNALLKYAERVTKDAAHPITADKAATDERDAVIEAARKLVKAKGRYHTELNYKALAEAVAAIAAAQEKDNG